ncbi:MarR family winged helix-turn-helix transcriptional regulator [Glutamicibacter sp. JC586]|uniref:MarR family winged helix-turn-helix transcriptional regulator n=1 Tax=Glutamicibacter sp. JC586 TaxID=2590552 RepID=UPI00135C0160|nr:MarR family transcriptional regulator [Glutamicibacter sp. JC586]
MQDEKLLQSVEDEFTAILLHARDMLIRRAKSVHPDLQAPGYRLLSLVIREDAQQQGALAEKLRLDKATISRLVQQLEALSLVVRTQDPSDGRAQLVSATDEARQKWRDSGNTLRQELRKQLTEWEETDLQNFGKLLHRLNISFEELV